MGFTDELNDLLKKYHVMEEPAGDQGEQPTGVPNVADQSAEDQDAADQPSESAAPSGLTEDDIKRIIKTGVEDALKYRPGKPVSDDPIKEFLDRPDGFLARFREKHSTNKE